MFMFSISIQRTKYEREETREFYRLSSLQHGIPREGRRGFLKMIHTPGFNPRRLATSVEMADAAGEVQAFVLPSSPHTVIVCASLDSP